ncbi:MAG: hypothetical protein LBL33_00770 [Tannerella sp.]|jgi:hypothetical protein|nr:hypothetical protein [Tannerella sp.]
MKTKYILLCCALCLIIGTVAGFLTGRRTVERAESVRYVKETPVTGKIELLEPFRVEIPSLPVLLTRTDTVYVDRVAYTREVVDTAGIIADYELRRLYKTQLFDNQYGKLDLSLSTQYNRLEDLSYEFTPVTKIVYREKGWRPFVSVSYGSLGYIRAEGWIVL